MSDYERGQWDMFLLISSTWWGKQYYFRQEVKGSKENIVYSRDSGQYMTVDAAYSEFLKRMGDDSE